jgi:hypothetical protein
MEKSQGNQCIAILNKKTFFFFTKTENRRADQVLLRGRWVTVGWGGMWGEGVGG